MTKVKNINHIAIAVKNLKEALTFYQGILGLTQEHSEIIKNQNVKVVFLNCGNIKLELIEPLSETSYIAKRIRKHGEGLAHICFEVDDLEAFMIKCRSHQCAFLTPETFKGAKKKEVIFLHPKDSFGALVEFMESTEDENRKK